MNYRKKAILMVMALFCLNVAILAQAVSLKMDNVSVKEAMTQLKNKSGYSFVYKVGDLDTKKIITVKAKELNEAIDQILYEQDVVYEVKGKNIIVQKRQAKQNTSKDGKKRKITGTVNDVNGEPIIGVTIKEKGTNNGTVSDVNAKFTLEVSPGAVLELSYIGYQPLEVKVGNQTDLSIVLYEKQELLDEVVVVGYGTMKKSDLNASIVSVKSEKLNKTASPNFSEMLMGRAAGLTVKQGSAQPGGGLEVLIRGAASTGAGNDPLYVVDGFPIVNAGVNPGSGNQWTAGNNSPLSSINPNDIESIEILKDASATAIYGARGANGVVLITTKRGTQDTKVEYNMNMSFQTINKRPELLTAGELMATQNSYYKEQYLMQNLVYPYGNTDPSAVSPYVPVYTDEEIAKAGKGTNWYDMITRTGLIQQHNLTVTYGNEKMKSLISLNYFDQKGVVKTSGYKRYSFRYNLDHKITKWWDYGISATASYVVDQNATLGGGYDSTAGIIESALSYSPTVKAERDPTTGKWIEDPKQALLNHPLSYLDIEDETKTKRFLATAFTNFYFIKDVFWLKLSAGADIRDGVRHSYYPMTTKYGSSVNGDANINSANREDYVADMVFNFQKTFKEKHKLLALLGYSYQVQNDDGAYARAMGFMSDALMYYKLQAGEDTSAMPDLLPGQRKYKDVNGLDEEGNLTGKPDGKIDQADVVYLGTRAPKFTMGFSNDFRYKGFDLNIYLYASVGGYSYPYTQVEHGVYGGNGIQRLKDNNNFLADIKNRWTSDNMGSAMPSGEVNSYDSYGAPNWEKNTYLRLKNVTLGYDLSRLFKANKLKVRFYFSGQNLLTFTGYKGLDPEVENDRAAYPQQKTFSFGLDVKF